MKFGFNLWFKDLKNLREIVSKASLVGLDHAEISIDYPFGIVEKGPLYTMAKTVREHGFTISLHAPWQEINLASPFKEIREASLSIVMKVLDEAYHLEATHVVVHLTSEQPVCKYRVGDSNPCLKAAVEVLEQLAKRAQEYGVYIAVENVSNSPCCGRIDQLAYILSSTTSPEIVLCLDIVHAITSDKHFLEKLETLDYYEVVKEWSSVIGSERIFELHLHGVKKENHRIEVHVDLTNVRMDVKNVFKTLGHGLKYVVFEIFKRSTGGEFDILDLAKIVREMKSWATVYEA